MEILKKITVLILTLIFLSGCVESVALLGPVSGSGNIAQSALSSSISYGVKKQTGKSPSEHVMEYVKNNNPEGKKEKCVEFIDQINSKTCAAIKAVIKKDISQKKIKIAKIKEGIFSKSKIENLAKQSDLLDR